MRTPVRMLLPLCWTALLILAPKARADTAVHVLPGGHEDEIRRFLLPLELGKPISPLCRLAGISIEGEAVALQIHCGASLPGVIRLRYPGAAEGGVHAGSVDVFADKQLPDEVVAAVGEALVRQPHPALPWVTAMPAQFPEAHAPSPAQVKEPTIEEHRLLWRPHRHEPDMPRAWFPWLLVALGVGFSAGWFRWPRFRDWVGRTAGRHRDAYREAWREDRALILFGVFALVVGAVLRLSLPGDIEYKDDEFWTSGSVEDMWNGHPFPRRGMGASIGIPFPPMSIWVFLLLARLTGADDPIQIARSVGLLNVVALGLLLAYATLLTQSERRPWIWTGALAAVNPLGVLLQRKIWPPSTLPFFMVLFFICWRARDRRWGAVGWGLLGGLVGQIHLAGFLSAGVLAGWTLVRERLAKDGPRTQWGPWLVGSAVTVLALLPWIKPLQTDTLPLMGYRGFHEAFSLQSWQMWVEDALGWNLNFSIGDENLRTIFAMPEVRGQPSHLVERAFQLAAAAGGAIVLGALLTVWRRRTSRTPAPATWAMHNVEFLGVCGLMALFPYGIWRHYLLAVFPNENLTLPLLGSGWRLSNLFLGVLWIAHLFIIVCVLSYLHAHHGSPGGDFGNSYSYQLQTHVPGT